MALNFMHDVRELMKGVHIMVSEIFKWAVVIICVVIISVSFVLLISEFISSITGKKSIRELIVERMDK